MKESSDKKLKVKQALGMLSLFLLILMIAFMIGFCIGYKCQKSTKVETKTINGYWDIYRFGYDDGVKNRKLCKKDSLHNYLDSLTTMTSNCH